MQFANSPFAFAESVKTQRSPASLWTAVGAHVVVLLALFALAAGRVTHDFTGKIVAPTLEPPPLTLPFARSNTGSGSQGANSLSEPGLGHPPQVDNVHLAPPVAPTIVTPQLQVAPTVDVQMPTNNMLNLGLVNANHPSVGIGVGKGHSVGDGDHSGINPGDTPGTGAGPGLQHAGSLGIHDPVLIYQVDPEFSEEARLHKFSGNVQIYLWVDELGHPSHVRVIRGVGMGLDEKAVEAVRQYKFKPAMQNGKPVKVDMYINVDFSIF
jgi:protein TonB